MLNQSAEKFIFTLEKITMGLGGEERAPVPPYGSTAAHRLLVEDDDLTGDCEVWCGSTPQKGQKSNFVIKSRWEGDTPSPHLSPLGAFSASILASLALAPLLLFWQIKHCQRLYSFSCGLFCFMSGMYYAAGWQTMLSCTVAHGVI